MHIFMLVVSHICHARIYLLVGKWSQ